MSTYLSRPVFEFDIDWETTPKKTYSYDLRQQNLAFANPTFDRLQEHTTRGVEFKMSLPGEEAIAAWDAFTEVVRGRLSGFWFPSPFWTAQLVSDVSSNTQCMIKDESLFDYWQDHPGCHLAFFNESGETQYAKIASVTQTSDGRELVLFDVPTADAVDGNWLCRKLLYVRLDNDVEEATVYGESRQWRTIRLVELPQEYTDIESGQIPVYLYELTLPHDGPTPVTEIWRMTGLNQTIVSNANTYSSMPIQHKEWLQAMDTTSDGMTLETWHDPPNNPISRFIPFTLDVPLGVKVIETSYGTPDVTKTLFTGRINSVSAQGRLLKANCLSLIDSVGRRYPRFFYQPRCNYLVYDRNCRTIVRSCGGNSSYLSGRVVKITFPIPTWPFPGRPESGDFNFFAMGYAEAGDGVTYERRSVRQSMYDYDTRILTLRLDWPFQFAVMGDLVQVYPGCDGSYATCDTKFFNLRHWGGHNSPPVNPAVRAMQAEIPSGNKK